MTVSYLAADVVRYSRLATADEDRTLARLRALRSDLIDPTIAVHNGRAMRGRDTFREMYIAELQAQRRGLKGGVGPSPRLTGRLPQGTGPPNILRMTSSASAAQQRPWPSRIRCGCQERIFPIAAVALRRWTRSGSRMPKNNRP